jgi:ribosomal protein S6
MDKRNFSRVADKKYTSGFFVNFIFEAPEAAIAQLRTRLQLNEDVFRAMFTVAAPPVPETAGATATK